MKNRNFVCMSAFYRQIKNRCEMNLPWYAYLPVVAGIIGGLIGGCYYKRNKDKKCK